MGSWLLGVGWVGCVAGEWGRVPRGRMVGVPMGRMVGVVEQNVGRAWDGIWRRWLGKLGWNMLRHGVGQSCG
jgi:hypothetical protein